MDRLIEAFKGLFGAATLCGGDVTGTANFVLNHVRWTDKLCDPEAQGHAVVDSCLQAVCAESGPKGPSTSSVATALLAVSDQLLWRSSNKNPDDGPDVVQFSKNCAVTTIIGQGALLPSAHVYAGLSLQRNNIYYPPHAHRAEESYWIIGGSGDWRVAGKPWFAVKPGDSIYHAPGVCHAMQTNEQPMLTLWLWTSHLDSEVVIVRG